MAKRIEIPFVGPQATSRSVLVNNQQTVNFMQAIKGQGAKAPIVLETVPGLVELGSVGNGAIRSSKMISSKVRAGAAAAELYGVWGSELVAMTTNVGNITIGTLDPNPGRVHMARGRNYIALVDGVSGYTYDGTTFAKITHPAFPGVSAAGAPTHILYLDGFFIVNDALTDNFYISSVEDPTTWNALDFEAAAVAPDAALALAATESLLWILGGETAQAYYNSGDEDFPYDIALSATQEVGILAVNSVAESDDGIFYLATTPEGGRFVYQIQGQAGRVITEDEQESFLTTVTDPTDAYAFIYKQAGKSFYVLQLSTTTGDNARATSTMIYNIKAKSWESREMLDGSAWRAGGAGILGNRNIVGSRLNATALELDLRNYQDAGESIIRRRRSQVIHTTNKLMDFWSLIVDVEGGVGNQVAPGKDPLLKMRYSDDGGRTWSAHLVEPVGKIGETHQRVKFDQLGSARNRVFEIELSDPVNLTILGAYAEIEVLAD